MEDNGILDQTSPVPDSASTGAASDKPNVNTDLDNTKKYLEDLRDTNRLITIRELIGYWGKSWRGKWINKSIRKDLGKMGFTTIPPFEVGPIDSKIQIMPLRDETPSRPYEDEEIAPAEVSHILAIGTVPSAGKAIEKRPDHGLPDGAVLSRTPIQDAFLIMMKNDFSQLPVLYPSGEDWKVKGYFSWESYGRAMIQGKNVATVADAMGTPNTVNFNDDLTANVKLIMDHDFVIVTFDGRFAGIITVSDLTQRFEQLALPFLLIGRSELEMKRVAEAFLGPFDEGESPSELTEGQLAYLFKDKWQNIPWKLSRGEFFKWLLELSQFRNKIAHFEDLPPEEIKMGCDSATRMTEWLESIETPKADSDPSKA